MSLTYLPYELNLWLLFALLLLCLLPAVEIGFRIGDRQRKRRRDAERAASNDVTLPALLALLGLMLAFTYSFSLSRADERKRAVTAEVKAISTAFVRADLLADPDRHELQEALYDYALTRRARPGSIRSVQQLEERITQSLRVQARLWPLLNSALQASGSSLTGAERTLLITAMNDVLDAHSQLVMTVYDRLPIAVLGLLLLIGAASLGVTGYNAGLTRNVSRIRISIFGLILAALMFVILDFDIPTRGTIVLNYSNMERMIADMRAALEGAP